MEQRSGTRHGLHATAATAALLFGLVLTACGGSSGNSASGESSSPRRADAPGVADGTNRDAVETDRDAVEHTIKDSLVDARATVVVDGVTYQFRPLPLGPDDPTFHSFCTTVAGSLQGGMQLVDDAGNPIDGGELDFILLEPGGLYEQHGDPAELAILFPGDNGISYIAEEIDAPASGRTASGTFTASNSIGGVISGTIDASC